VRSDRGAVDVGDCADDGQAEAVAAAVGRAAWMQPLEGLEESADLGKLDENLQGQRHAAFLGGSLAGVSICGMSRST
jgi:hypothetical protein